MPESTATHSYSKTKLKLLRNSIIAIVGLLLCSYSLAQDSIRLAYGHSYAPFSWLQQGEVKGLQVDILTELFEKRLGIKTVHRAYPWKRAQWQVQTGQDDAMLTANTPERSLYTHASTEVLIPVNYYVYTYRDHPQLQEMLAITDVEGFKQFHLVEYLGGSLAGFSADDLQISMVPELDAALKFLAQRRADIFIESAQITEFNIKKMQLDNNIVQVPFIVETNLRRLLISKQSPFAKKMQQIDKAIAAMKADGTINRLQQKYLQ
ncbi:transporter substrate-binding domain-containing protein [Dasania sp. GY-MA-18]|uniref:Transporter substrate-binding domain-containing protein n=1 Tax=Dasania phycosphaerae TaxID=2950436 RepID=A0A9J6RJN1_9GAMM|nr:MULTISPECIES: transporter substrate-binding domain-containing protein [Dasania]MCR8922255.1 transporter substrate-binding domain-containing protein [Dasania sp. GY-MA-18]MCZ0864683.1 transporter substrate-binding domain-containing protein [Dasania phycosphaerae]MCZ0868411.1 transporter substrate-binding domain-containing protein [Dasania phycosphaerae]